MTNKNFWSGLALITVAVSGLLIILTTWIMPTLSVHNGFGGVCVALFVLISVFLYWAAQNAIRSTNKFAFSNLISVSVFGKMVFALGFLFAYQKMAHPTDQGFVGIFLLNYIVYTIFEVWFMTKLARSK